MKTTKNLNATLQKSYYGKAKIIEDDYVMILKSYDTQVLAIIKENKKIVRLWNGWSRTTANHVNDFLMQNGFKSLSKKEWLNLPCEKSDPVYNVYMSTGFYTHKCPALLTETEAEKEIERIYNNNNTVVAWYE